MASTPLSPIVAAFLALASLPSSSPAVEADLILHHGKIVTVDPHFSIQEAIAVKGSVIQAVGPQEEILKLRGAQTEIVDLEGKMVMPGLIDSHVHPADASLTEFDHPIPDLETIPDILAHIRERAKVVKEGDWIQVQQVFITRLREQRYPTRTELDEAAPHHPVYFRTGPDAQLNTLALQLSGIGKDFQVTDGGNGFIEKDPVTGEPTGLLRSCTRFAKVKSSDRAPTEAERSERLKQLFADYNSVGLTAICDRDASIDGIELYRALRDGGELTIRIRCSQDVSSSGPLEKVENAIHRIGKSELHTQADDWLRVIGIKTYLDGGMLTGTAYMRKPWGVSAIYGITDPAYQGILFIPKDRLVPMVRAAVSSGLQFTAHSVGDGAVHALLDAYTIVAGEGLPVRETRCCLTHSNFMSQEAVEAAAKLGVVEDIQPVWLYLDAHTLLKQFGYDRLRYFQPLHSIFAAGGVAGGGSDHMQKIGAMRAINLYNPFVGIATAVERKSRFGGGPLHPEEALTREEALRFYTINNAKILFLEDRTGSIEAGKLADLVVLNTDLLTCQPEEIAKTQVLRTYVGGRLVYRR